MTFIAFDLKTLYSQHIDKISLNERLCYSTYVQVFFFENKRGGSVSSWHSISSPPQKNRESNKLDMGCSGYIVH